MLWVVFDDEFIMLRHEGSTGIVMHDTLSLEIFA